MVLLQGGVYCSGGIQLLLGICCLQGPDSMCTALVGSNCCLASVACRVQTLCVQVCVILACGRFVYIHACCRVSVE
jgi:hypothetical protein